MPTRNPEELLEVLTLLTWAVRALTEADRAIPEPLAAAIDRIAPALRALRHADGGLARFHGGGKGMEGRLDQALAAAGVAGDHRPCRGGDGLCAAVRRAHQRYRRCRRPAQRAPRAPPPMPRPPRSS